MRTVTGPSSIALASLTVLAGTVLHAAGQADLSLTNTVDELFPDVGTNVVFTLTVDNAGPSPATGVEVVDVVPSGYRYVSDDGAGAYDSPTGVWSVGALAAGGSATLNITARVVCAGSYTNAGEVTSSDQPDPDSTPNNGLASEDDYAEAFTIPAPAADLSLDKTVDDPGPAVGDPVVFTLTLSNVAELCDAVGIEVTDMLPSGYAYASDDSAGQYDPGTGLWTVGALGAGASTTLNITATVNPGGVYRNTAEVTATQQSDPDSTPGNGVTSEDDYAEVSTVPNSIRTLDVSQDKDDIVLVWQPRNGAAAYRVYESPVPDAPRGSWSLLAEVGAPEYRDAGAALLQDRCYSVTAVFTGGEGPH